MVENKLSCNFHNFVAANKLPTGDQFKDQRLEMRGRGITVNQGWLEEVEKPGTQAYNEERFAEKYAGVGYIYGGEIFRKDYQSRDELEASIADRISLHQSMGDIYISLEGRAMIPGTDFIVDYNNVMAKRKGYKEVDREGIPKSYKGTELLSQIDRENGIVERATIFIKIPNFTPLT